MNFKKIFITFIIFIIFIFMLYVVSYADDENEYEIDYNFNESFLENASSNVNEFPTINARFAVIYDRASGTALYSKNSDQKCKMASTTKIMTAIVVIENANLTDTVTISKKSASTGGSRLGLSTNDTITVENLLYGLMLCSGNDAAVALAEYVGGNVDEFATLMNKKAHELGLFSTNYVTPHGLDNDDHFTTAFELAKLSDYALSNETFAKIVNTKSYAITINNRSKTLRNTNELLGNYDGIYGVKTGFTNGANRCLVTACKKNNLDVICVVLGCDTKKDRTKDSVKLLDFAFNNFTTINIEKIVDTEFNNWISDHKNCFIITKGISNSIVLELNKADMPYSNIAIPISDQNNIYTNIEYNSFYSAPLLANTQIGTITIKINDSTLFSLKISNSNFVKKKNIFNYLYYFTSNYTNILISNF